MFFRFIVFYSICSLLTNLSTCISQDTGRGCKIWRRKEIFLGYIVILQDKLFFSLIPRARFRTLWLGLCFWRWLYCMSWTASALRKTKWKWIVGCWTKSTPKAKNASLKLAHNVISEIWSVLLYDHLGHSWSAKLREVDSNEESLDWLNFRLALNALGKGSSHLMQVQLLSSLDTHPRTCSCFSLSSQRELHHFYTVMTLTLCLYRRQLFPLIYTVWPTEVKG